MPWDKSKYPPNWPEIAGRIKERAGWKCQWCHKPHNTKIPGNILTVHHLDGDPSNCEDYNLRALCQRCHLSDESRVKALKRKREIEKTQIALEL